MANFNQKLFRQLLKKGIGLRTQKEFAEETGITQETISRMLNDDEISKPRLKTIETFAKHMPSVTENELLEACGYETISIDNVVKDLENNISDFFAFSEKNYFDSFKDFTEKLEIFIRSAKWKKETVISVTNKEEIKNKDMTVSKQSEMKADVYMSWKHDKHFCQTKFTVFYAETVKGAIIITEHNIDSPGKKTTVTRMSAGRPLGSQSAEFMLLKSIFGDKGYGENSWTVTGLREGYGFNLNGTPEGFLDFLDAKAEYFCAEKENILLYNRIVNGEDPETVFSNYRGLSNYCGTGAVIAYIMMNEANDSFLYYGKDEGVPEEIRSECIMAEAEGGRLGDIDPKIMTYLYKCAKLLKIPEFGAVYHSYRRLVDSGQVFRTDSIFL